MNPTENSRLDPKKFSFFSLVIVYCGLLAILALPPFENFRASLIILCSSIFAWICFCFFNKNRWTQISVQPNFTKQVLIQTLVQGSVYVFWGMNEPMVLKHLPSMVFQLLFSPFFYFFCCSLFRQKFRPGFWMFAVVFSFNFFIWFRKDYFWGHVVLLMIAIMAKMFFIRKQDGNSRHIFNPSGFALSVASIFVILLAKQSWILGDELTTSFYNTPNFGIFLFLVGCVTQWIPNMYMLPLGAVLFLTIGDLCSRQLVGLPLLVLNSHSSIFLGITLLITDPRTSPTSNGGRFLFGLAYGLSIAIAFSILVYFGQPTFYDKVLFVPILNYLAPLFDKIKFYQPWFSKLSSEITGTFVPRLLPLLTYALVFVYFYNHFYLKSEGPFSLDFR